MHPWHIPSMASHLVASIASRRAAPRRVASEPIKMLPSAGVWTRALPEKGGHPKEKGHLPMTMGAGGHGKTWIRMMCCCV